MQEFEFVNKKEYSPIRQEIELIIKKVQKKLKKDNDLTFQFKLIGSGKKHLITRIKGGNLGYDFDYNLILNNNEKPEVRDKIFKLFQEAIKGTRFNKIENSTSVITIKQVDNKNNKVIVGCDFSVIICNNDDEYRYVRYNKKNENFTWEIRNLSRFNNKKLFEICKHENGWNDLRDEYIKLKKRNNDKDKHSFILYYEAINNLYNQYCQIGIIIQ